MASSQPPTPSTSLLATPTQPRPLLPSPTSASNSPRPAKSPIGHSSPAGTASIPNTIPASRFPPTCPPSTANISASQVAAMVSNSCSPTPSTPTPLISSPSPALTPPTGRAQPG